MAKIGSEVRYRPMDIHPFGIPVQKPSTSKGMAQIIKAGAVGIRRIIPAELGADLPERIVGLCVVDFAAVIEEEEGVIP